MGRGLLQGTSDEYFRLLLTCVTLIEVYKERSLLNDCSAKQWSNPARLSSSNSISLPEVCEFNKVRYNLNDMSLTQSCMSFREIIRLIM